jgi:nicotinamide-nucleotide amidase
MITTELADSASKILALYRDAGLMLTTAESCTGGLIIGALTEVSGSSSVVDRGFVTYSNEAKNELIGVDMALIIEYGAVSRPVAEAMAVGALARSRADAAVSVTGVAGPGGGTAEKPVGLVFMGGVRKGREAIVQKHNFEGDRSAVRHATVLAAMDMFELLASS